MNLTITSNKNLKLDTKGEKIYVGENETARFIIKLNAEKLGGLVDVTTCAFTLYAVLESKEMIAYPLTFDTSAQAYVNISADITDTAQTVKLFVKADAGEGVIGKTNTVDVVVYESPDGTEVPSRADIDAANEELEAVLDGTYVPESEGE